MTGRPVTSATPFMQGLSWFGVEVTASEPSACTTSHAQPEPKRVAPALAKACLKASNPPSSASIAAASWPVGAPPPEGAEDLPEKAVVGVSSTVVAYSGALGFGHSGEIADDFAKAFFFQAGSGESFVQLGYVGVVVFGVVDLHCTGIEVWFERVVGVVKAGNS